MKALLLNKPGSTTDLQVGNITDPVPGPGEVRVKVHAVGLNPVDYKLAASGFPGWQYPFILGLDVAGVIDAVGGDVENWHVGDAVYYHGDLRRPGGYAERAIVVAHAISPLPKNLTFTEAAALPCAGFTAYQAIFRKLSPRPRQSILIHGGAGGVGGFAVQLAAMTGLYVMATASVENFSYVRQLGADEVLDYRHPQFRQKLVAATSGNGIDAIVNTIGPESATEDLDSLAYGGELICIAGLPDLSNFAQFVKAISIHEITLGGAYRSNDHRAQADLARIGKEMGALVERGRINPSLGEVIKLDQIPQALQRIAQRHVRGKIVADVIG